MPRWCSAAAWAAGLGATVHAQPGHELLALVRRWCRPWRALLGFVPRWWPAAACAGGLGATVDAQPRHALLGFVPRWMRSRGMGCWA
ncbi:MAG TPA: hypothetical protein VGJ28_26730 [Micromonosporaceae bacterium]